MPALDLQRKLQHVLSTWLWKWLLLIPCTHQEGRREREEREGERGRRKGREGVDKIA